MTDTNTDVIDAQGGLGHSDDHNEYLHHYRTVDSVTIPKEYFEKVRPDERAPRAVLRTVLGNPFPMYVAAGLCTQLISLAGAKSHKLLIDDRPLMGFLMASTPLGCTLMGWRGAGGQGAALVGTFYFFGGMLQIIGSVMEWIIGNTFPCVVFASYGAFWLSLGATLTPFYNATAAYYTASENSVALAIGKAEFYDTYAFFYMIMTVLTLFYVIASLRTNIVLVITFFFIDAAFFMLMATYWTAAEGKAVVANGLQIAAGAFVFTFCMSGWYLWCSLILSALDFPFILPLGDLSTRIPSGEDMARRRQESKNAEQQVNGADAVKSV